MLFSDYFKIYEIEKSIKKKKIARVMVERRSDLLKQIMLLPSIIEK